MVEVRGVAFRPAVPDGARPLVMKLHERSKGILERTNPDAVRRAIRRAIRREIRMVKQILAEEFGFSAEAVEAILQDGVQIERLSE